MNEEQSDWPEMIFPSEEECDSRLDSREVEIFYPSEESDLHEQSENMTEFASGKEAKQQTKGESTEDRADVGRNLLR